MFRCYIYFTILFTYSYSQSTYKYVKFTRKLLKFLVPPRIVPFSFEEPIFAGQAAQVTCLVSEGDLPLNITWTYKGLSNRSMSEMGISTSGFGQKTSMLLIESTDASHRGNYTCIAQSLSNLKLSSQYTAELNIHGKHTLRSRLRIATIYDVDIAWPYLRFCPYYTLRLILYACIFDVIQCIDCIAAASIVLWFFMAEILFYLFEGWVYVL